MIAKADVRTIYILIGKARDEGRMPSHDGESLTLYYVPGDDRWLLEDNGGVAASSFDPRPDGTEEDSQWDGILDEVAIDITMVEKYPRADDCGAEASEVMAEWGWLEDDGEAHHILRPMTYEVIVDGEVVYSGPDYARALEVDNEEWLGGGEPTLRRSDGRIRMVDGGWTPEEQVT